MLPGLCVSNRRVKRDHPPKAQSFMEFAIKVPGTVQLVTAWKFRDFRDESRDFLLQMAIRLFQSNATMLTSAGWLQPEAIS